MDDSCKDCLFFLRDSTGVEGCCRRYPPRVFFEGSLVYRSKTPRTTTTAWCGEFKAKS